jgi:glutamyl-tRNA reductase
MTLALIGANFREISLPELERLESAGPALAAAIFSPASQVIEGGVLISTCNRLEVYLDTDEPELASAFITAKVREIAGVELGPRAKNLTGSLAIQHLFKVSAGLDSMIVGEAEIAGQVKRSFQEAQSGEHTSRIIEALFQRAASISKRVASETGLGASGRSLVATGLDLVQSSRENLDGDRALVIGTGAYARVSIAALERRGVKEIYIYSPSGRAEEFSESHKTIPVTLDQLAKLVLEVDVIIACSGIHERIITKAMLASRMTPVSVVDLSLGRDVEAEIAEIGAVKLIDLNVIYECAPREHYETVAAAEDLIDQAVEQFQQDLVARASDPLVRALRSHVQSAVSEEVARVKDKHGSDYAELVARSLQVVTKAIFHQPTISAKDHAVKGELDEYQRAIQILFGLEVSADE